jgi:hypothetical protein
MVRPKSLQLQVSCTVSVPPQQLRSTVTMETRGAKRAREAGSPSYAGPTQSSRNKEKTSNNPAVPSQPDPSMEQDKRSKKKTKNQSKRTKNPGQPDTAKSSVLMLHVHGILSAPVLASNKIISLQLRLLKWLLVIANLSLP